MPDERFNNLIKKKLESVQPPYREEAWKNFSKLLPSPWYVTIFHQYRNWMYGGVGAVMVTVISILYFQQNKENQKLHETIATLEEKVTEQNNKQKPVADRATMVISDSTGQNAGTNPSQNSQSDTIFQVKKETANPSIANIDQGINQAKQNQLTEKPVPAEDKSRTAINRLNRDKRNANQSGSDMASKPNMAGNNQHFARKEAVANNLNSDKLDSALTGNYSSNNKPESEKTGTVNTMIDADSAKQMQSQNLALVSKDTTSGKNKLPIDSAMVNKPDDLEKAEQKSQFLGLQARFGVNVSLGGLNKLAFGPHAEFLVGKHWSIGTGLNFSRPEEEQHQDPKDFNRAKGKRFEDMYHVWLQPNDKIEKIDLQTTVLRLPLSVNYYLPIKGNFSFLFTGGTTLDLTVNQEVDFERTPPGGGAEYYKFNAKPQPKTFNNLLYGIGVQYQKNRLVGQIAPYYIYQFVNPEYYSPTSKIGINAMLKINLRKAGN